MASSAIPIPARTGAITFSPDPHGNSKNIAIIGLFAPSMNSTEAAKADRSQKKPPP
jgi:hypothetical protein